MDLSWMLRRPYVFPPAGKFQVCIQLAPFDVHEWLQEQAAVPAQVQYEHRWEPNYDRGRGLLVD